MEFINLLNPQKDHMPLLFYFFISMIYLPSAVFSQQKRNKQESTASTPYQQKDTVYWVVNFEQFRDALYHRNNAKTKQFFDFPIDTEGTELWYVALNGFSYSADVATYSKYFTAKDPDKHFGNVFPAVFINGFLKIKMKELYKNGHSESPEWEKEQTTYKLSATYDQKNSLIELNLSIRSGVKVSANEWDPIESNLIYRFSVRPKGHIKFRQLFVAG
jgi:hypothetical protein